MPSTHTRELTFENGNDRQVSPVVAQKVRKQIHPRAVPEEGAFVCVCMRARACACVCVLVVVRVLVVVFVGVSSFFYDIYACIHT